MPDFTVNIFRTERYVKTVNVIADTADEAYNIAKQSLNNGEYDTRYGFDGEVDNIETEIEVEEE